MKDKDFDVLQQVYDELTNFDNTNLESELVYNKMILEIVQLQVVRSNFRQFLCLQEEEMYELAKA